MKKNYLHGIFPPNLVKHFFKCLILFSLIAPGIVFAQNNCIEIERVLVSACGTNQIGGPFEGHNEMIQFRVGPNSVNISNLSVFWPGSLRNAGYTWLGSIQNAQTAAKVAEINATIKACGYIKEPLNNQVPANSKVILFTSFLVSATAHSFANLSDTLYAVFQNNNNVQTAGHFLNFPASYSISTIGGVTVVTNNEQPPTTEQPIRISIGQACSDSVGYMRTSLLNSSGNIGPGSGSAVRFDPDGKPTYYNGACEAIFTPFSAAWNNPGPLCVSSAQVDLKNYVTGNSGGTWTGPGTSSNSSILNLSGLSGNISVTYTVNPRPGCTGQPASETKTIQIVSSVNISISGPSSICPGQSATLTASGASLYQWSNGASGSTINVSPQQTTTYTVSATVNGCTATASRTITVGSSLPASVSISVPKTNICPGESLTFTATPTNGGTNPIYQWSVNGSIVTGPAGNTFTPTNLANNSNVTVTMTPNGGCVSTSPVSSNSITIQVSSLPASVSISAPKTSICSGESLTFTASPTNGGNSPTYQWRVNGSNVSGNGNTFISTTLTNNAQVSVVMTSSGTCITGSPATSSSITITVNGLPNAGSNGTATFCKSDLSSNLFNRLAGAPDFGGVWSPKMASGTGVFNPAIDPAGTYTYTVTGQCGSQSATVAVTLNNPPNPGSNGTAVFCNSDPASNLFNRLGGTPDPGGVWSPKMASGTGAFNPAVDPAGTYTYTVSGQCGSKTATVVVTLNNPPNAGSNGTAAFCKSDPASNLFNRLGGTPDPGGVWSPKMASGTGAFNPATDPAGTYTYTVTGQCGSKTATVTVTLNNPPNAGSNGAATFCKSDQASNLFNRLVGTPDPGGVWSPKMASNTGVFNPALDPAGTYTYTVTGQCGSKSAAVVVTLSDNITPSVNISASQETICPGDNVTFTATPGNVLSNAVYQWKVNGTNVSGNGNSFSSSTLVNNDKVSVVMTASGSCVTGSSVTSNEIIMKVNPSSTPSVSISASKQVICEGETVTFTALPLSGGAGPTYQWKINGQNAGTNSPLFTSTFLKDKDQISVVMTSNSSCVSAPIANSNTVSMVVNPLLPVSVSINAFRQTICSGENIDFTASPTNGGSNPVYQWRVNGTNVNGSGNTFSSASLSNDDRVSVLMTSNGTCIIGSPAASNEIKIQVNPTLNASVSVSATKQIICPGQSITFTANPINGGANPVYQWKVNGINVNGNGNTFSSSSLSDNDKVSVLMTAAGACISGSPATSEVISISVIPNLGTISALKDTVCAGSDITLKLSGNASQVQWQSSVKPPDFSPINGATNSSISEIVKQNTWFRVIRTNSDCPDTTEAYFISTKPSPVANFTFSKGGNTIAFKDASFPDGLTYNWDFGDSKSSTVSNPSNTFTGPGPYTVCLTVKNKEQCANTICKTIDLATSFSSPDSPELIRIFPNPVSDNLSIHFDGNLTNAALINMYDLSGRLVSENFFVPTGTNIFQMQISHIPQGIYFIKIEREEGTMLKKFVKQNQ